ncbi:hypothetical protein SNOG_12269 [Parastagonospora nodorum SN15]|uniref:Uncharacterized protein n=1 Tax=Phaeosphaeria nodorum (strain SN15 / ATCC MYA-4574 / FGSC 10173) TaxID=321614 RepID=Q0U7J5_PHANO|nr:hypothetical protein SNOG_12269 [Parastagonospora nodorum SN15]EAT80681.1 hypothetical protein SNOG_12269 [Parastagonospora nodorum SN15]
MTNTKDSESNLLNFQSHQGGQMERDVHYNQQPLIHSDWSMYNRFSGYAHIATTAMPSSRTGADAGLGTEMRYVLHLGLEVMSAMCLRFGYHYIRINSSAIATYQNRWLEGM